VKPKGSPLKQSGIMRLLVLQASVAIIFALIMAALSGVASAFAVLVGAIIYLLPTWVFATVLMRKRGAHAAKQIVAAFYWGEALKLVITIGLFLVAINFFAAYFPLLLITYIVMQLLHWLAPIIVKTGL